MKIRSTALAAGVLALATAVASAQTQVQAVAVDPNDATQVWTLNRDNNSVALVDTTTDTVLNEIAVGVFPHSLAFNADGSKLLVVNLRGNVPITTHFSTPFTGTEVRGSISVIDVASKTVVQTLTDVGTEPYGISLAPNGKFFALTTFRSGDVRFLDESTYAELARFEYDWNLNFIDAGLTIADLDEDFDGTPDYGTPRGFAMTADSSRMYVTHWKSQYVSMLDITLDSNGLPTGANLAGKINQDDYGLHPLNNPVPVQTIDSQGRPTFSADIAISPDGTRALVPQLLLNINHDVGHDFGLGLEGDFANRVYPSLTILDIAADSYNQPGDTSGRLEHELTDPTTPAMHVSYGPQGKQLGGGIATLGANGAPILGATTEYVLTGGQPTDLGFLLVGSEINLPLAPYGTLLVSPTLTLPMTNDGTGTFKLPITLPTTPALEGVAVAVQGVKIQFNAAAALSNGIKTVLSADGPGAGNMGHRAGHPFRVMYNDTGDRALMLNQGSEDVFLYSVNGSDMELMSVFPPRFEFAERAAFDTTTPMGDMPTGWAMVADATTSNDDALLYIQNEVTRTLSTLRVDFETGTITQEADQITTITGPDKKTQLQLIGQEIFHDASRAQTTANFNNSCASCHNAGGEDGQVWQRPAGPRSTMPTYGGPLLTGLLLWKGTRLGLHETGPMFGGENGGAGAFSDQEQEGLIAYHEVIPVPLNPFFDAVTNDLSPLAQFGQDLFFGTNNTGLNPGPIPNFPELGGRSAGCANCHPQVDQFTGQTRAYTADFLDPSLTSTLDFGFQFDSICQNLQENIVSLNIRAVNSEVNHFEDTDGDGILDTDRNGDGYDDTETYVPLFPDTDDPFVRDDPNSYLCLTDPADPGSAPKVFGRAAKLFSIPTKLGVLHTGPYMHDHSLISLRHVLDPVSQMLDPVYGDAGYPGTLKWFNEFHDLRGHEDLVPLSSKVQISLQSTDVDGDIDAILAYIQSL
ncbi:MAG: YncE family protein [Planctomycetota bacterium]|jgi:YVTN family beta-propeller protein